jgi:hypothetical protein
MSGLKKIGGFDLNERRRLIELANSNFSQRQQCALLSISRSGLYYEPRQPTGASLLLMRAIDEEYMEHPYYGRRRMTIAMKKKGLFCRSDGGKDRNEGNGTGSHLSETELECSE